MRDCLVVLGLAALALSACGDDGAASDASPVTDDTSPAIDGSQPDALVPACSPTPGTNLTFEPVVRGLVSPILVTAAPGDARLFVVEQDGRIRIVKDGALLPAAFLDIDDRVNSAADERGLLGLAFHPDYPTDPRFFVNYSATTSPAGSGATVIAEYRVTGDPDVADSGSEVRLLEIAQPFNNHNGGGIAFGQDGYLYIGMGDGGLANDPSQRAQNLASSLGKMLRIDVSTAGTYAIPATNPHAASPDGPGDPRREIWARGLRNPWRWSFDRQTGDLYIGDVGQGTIEEIDFQAANSAGGENYGWDCREGDNGFETGNCPAGTVLVAPVSTYEHTDPPDRRCSVTGGHVYRGSCLPDLQGTYIFGDYCSGEVWGFEYTGTPNDSPNEFFDIGQDLTSFGEDATGELYITQRDGTVYRIVADN